MHIYDHIHDPNDGNENYCRYPFLYLITFPFYNRVIILLSPQY